MKEDKKDAYGDLNVLTNKHEAFSKGRLSKDTLNLINKTFDNQERLITKLPTNVEFKKKLDLQFRDLYIKKSFIILTHEFLLSLKNLLGFYIVSELCCGLGYFSYWLGKYNINIKDSIDNKSWESHKYYLDFVKEYDAIEYVKNNSDVEVFILSWPYMDSVAFDIWNVMKKGQYLLYIGEGYGGCTADDNFFEAIMNKEIENIHTQEMLDSFLSFRYIHDRPYLLLK